MERALRIAVLGLVLGGLGLTWHRVAVSPQGRVLWQDPAAPWIQAQTEPSLRTRQFGDPLAPAFVFATSFALTRPPGSARLTLRSFGSARVELNGEIHELPALDDWKRYRSFDVAEALVPGANQLRVEVRNLHGPALLSLRLEGEGVSLRSGPDWSAGRGEATSLSPAALATDQRPLSDAAHGEPPPAMLLRHAGVIALWMLAGAGGLVLWQRRPASWNERGLLAGIAAVVVLAWGFLFIAKLAALPLAIGFDASDHVAYLNRLLVERVLPDARDGWAMYHPPLFYLTTLGLAWLLVPLGVPSAVGIKLLPFLAGLGQVGIAFWLCRVLAPGDRRIALLAVLFAATLPMNLTAAAYLSNEGLHALLSGAALVLACRILRRDDGGSGALVALSVLLGLALLTKYTALVTVACAGGGVLLAQITRGRPAAGARRGVAALLLPMLALSGWFYLRNVLRHGRPFVGNWSLQEPGHAWWSPPGLRTPAFYTTAGEALTRPYLAIRSFWDSLYTTLWGDGFLGGQILLAERHPLWNYELMSAGYLLALPATLLLLAGVGLAAREAFADTGSHRRGALALLVVSFAAHGFAIFYATLGLPFYGQARSLYALATTPALAFFFALATSRCDAWLARRGGLAARAALAGWLGALFGVFYLSFAG